jgi:cephalosporin-C deacetylase-like acetyl esterase
MWVGDHHDTILAHQREKALDHLIQHPQLEGERAMKKTVCLILSTLLLLLHTVGLAAADEPGTVIVHTVEPGDTLWGLAQQYLGDGAAYPTIVAHTNEASALDPLYAHISDPDVIEPGWHVVLSGANVAQPGPQYGITETEVTFENMGQTIAGTLALPEDAEGPYPVVLLFHGFLDQRDELPITGTEDGLFERAARTLAEQGYASLRIDFRGSGESDGQWADTTFSGQITDAIAAVDYVSSLPDIDHRRIAVLGFSQGGLVAASTAARDSRVASAILWAPVSNPPATYSGILGTEAVQAGLLSAGEVVTTTLSWGGETGLRTLFFEDLYNVDPVAEISGYDGPLMVIVGLNDTIVAPQPQSGEVYLRYHPGEETLVELVATHQFDCFVGTERVDEAIHWSLTWLDDTL